MRENPIIKMSLSKEQWQRLSLSLQTTYSYLKEEITEAKIKDFPEYAEILLYEKNCCEEILDQIETMISI